MGVESSNDVQGADHLLHRLYEIQLKYGYISKEVMLCLSKELQLPITQVEGVVDFYSFFYRTPRGRYHLLFSHCTSCGDLSLMQRCCEVVGISAGETRSDGLVSIDSTSCIGMCDQGPALLINQLPIVNLDDARIDQLVLLMEQQTPICDWPSDWFTVQEKVCRAGLLLHDTLEVGAGLRAALRQGREALLQSITDSGLRGRGGAGFSAGMKWRFCREAVGEAHYVICNADEGEPGTFKDRMLLREHADTLFEGMTIGGYVIGAEKGFLYLRGEYRYLLSHLQQCLVMRRQQGLLGSSILGEAFNFDIEIVVGAGAYICGEESALIESLEQKRGVPRVRPPFPVTSGYLGQPTIVNNVETLVAATHIALHGGAWFAAHGTASSKGSKILSISGDCARPGVYEYDFGLTIAQMLEDCGATDTQAVQIGGPSGRLIAAKSFDRTIAFDDLATGGSMMIYGGQRNMLNVVQNFAHFFAHESCGFCTPCRVGTQLMKNGVDKIATGHGTAYDMDELKRLSSMVKRRSHCGLGQTAPNPILNAMESFPEAFIGVLTHHEYEPYFDLDRSLNEARRLTGRDDAEAHLS